MVGIIGAMEQEVLWLISSLKNMKEEIVLGFHFYTGLLENKEVVIARAGIGKVNAAICAQTMILTYHPNWILNSGVAGALDKRLHVKDIVLSSSFVEHDMDTSPIGDPVGLLTIHNQNLIEIPTEKNLFDQAKKVLEESQISYLSGLIATGDQFIASNEQKERIMKHFPAVCCEMEGGAIAHACYAANVPFLAIRSMSDSADGSSSLDYPTFVKEAAVVSEKIVITLVRKIAY